MTSTNASPSAFPPEAMPDTATEADEMFQNAGEKGRPHRDPDDPPRRRANKRPGAGTFDHDRPPIVGVVGRTSGAIELEVITSANQKELEGQVTRTTQPDATVFTDEAAGYRTLRSTGRSHATVCHSIREWARDDDGDGLREVHCNSCEGLWTSVRNFLRPFRGVSKWFLFGYIALFACAFQFKTVTPDLLACLLGPTGTIPKPSRPGIGSTSDTS